MHLFKDYWDQKLEMPSGYVNHVFCSAKISDLKSIPNWGILAELIKNDSERYFIGKKTCHSSNYGIEAAKFRISILKDSEGKVVLSYEQATQFLVLYHSLFPEIRDWHRRVEQELKTNERLSNLFGFPREFSFHRIDTKLLMEAYAFVPQSTVGTLTNIAYTEMFEYIEEQNLEEWDLLNNKHDSYLLQCPPEDTTRAAVKMKELIAKHEFTSPIDKATFHMKSEAAVGQNWGKYHKIYNPEGMKELVC